MLLSSSSKFSSKSGPLKEGLELLKLESLKSLKSSFVSPSICCSCSSCVFSSEWDEDACKTYTANFSEHPAGDITKISAADIPDFDILLGGFP